WASPWFGVLINTNVTTLLQAPQDAPAKFVRLSPDHPGNEECVNNLRQIRFAIKQWAEDNHKCPCSTVSFDSLKPYFIDQREPMCPSYTSNYIGSYTIVDVQTLPPVCQIVPWSHRLEEP